MTAGQGAALVLLAVAGGVGLAGELAHHARRDADRAVLRLRTHRFDGSTRARISTWLSATGEQDQSRLVAEEAGWFDRAVVVRLERPEAGPARFEVLGGAVRPLDAHAEAVVAAVRDFAAQPERDWPAASPPAVERHGEVPPVRPFVPAPASP